MQNDGRREIRKQYKSLSTFDRTSALERIGKRCHPNLSCTHQISTELSEVTFEFLAPSLSPKMPKDLLSLSEVYLANAVGTLNDGSFST